MRKAPMLTLFVLLSLGGGLAYILHWPTFGQSPEGEKLEELRKSRQFRDGVFQNGEATALSSVDSSTWEMLKLQFGGHPDRQPSRPVPSVKRSLKAETQPDSVHLTWLGHSSLLIRGAARTILVDPVMSGWASPIKLGFGKSYSGANPYTVEDLPPIDFVLITHDHYDHLDFETIVALNADVQMFFVPLGLGSHLERWGVPGSKINEMDWWDEFELDGVIKLALTPARHFSGRSLRDRNKTLWASFVLQLADKKIFLSGDSGYGKHFKEIGAKYGPFDLTVLECGQYFKYWPEIHMLPEETAQAHIELGGKLLMPIHWGKFTMAFHPWLEPVERLLKEAEKGQIQVLTPLIGEEVVLGLPIKAERWWHQL